MTGFICLYKPQGITSFAAVARVRRFTGEKKTGHCGTLDPMATGVLPIMLGGATKFLDYLPSERKSYKAVMRLGVLTDTLDITGEVLETREVEVGFEDVVSVCERFVGEISQVPPMYSAVKVDGVRMYELARKGLEAERKPRQVTIFSLKCSLEDGLLENEYVLEVECSKGTYIRTLIDDIGRALGCGATMSRLERTESSGFKLEDCVTLEELEAAFGEGASTSSDYDADENGAVDCGAGYVIPVDKALEAYPSVVVSEGQAVRFSNGGSLNLDRLKGCKVDGLYRAYSPSGEFLGLGSADFENGVFSVARVYVGR